MTLGTARLGRSAVAVTRLGLGCAQLGNLYVEIDEAQALATVDAAWAAGVRYFDTAPHYGLGLSERRLGVALRAHPRDEYVVSTKVGRLLVPDPGGAGRTDDDLFQVPADHRRVWDFTADGVRRSLADSLRRLGLDRVDVVLIHDPEDHADIALHQAFPALAQLRGEGVVGAVGVGSKDCATLHRFVTETASPRAAAGGAAVSGSGVDVVMLAGRYTLLEQPALDQLLPACLERGVSVLNVGVFNSGLLAVDQPHDGLPYDYFPAPREVVDRARAVAAACDRHGTSLPAAALAFAAAHPAVAAVLPGAQSPEQVHRNAALFTGDRPPAQLWADLVAEGLLRAGTPVPGGIS